MSQAFFIRYRLRVNPAVACMLKRPGLLLLLGCSAVAATTFSEHALQHGGGSFDSSQIRSAAAAVAAEAPRTTPPPPRFILDHDGGIDDLMALLLLLAMPPEGPRAIELLGVIVIGADSIGPMAVNTTLKLLHLLGRGEVPVALSTLAGVHPFPDAWRWAPAQADTLPILNNLQVSASQSRKLHT